MPQFCLLNETPGLINLFGCQFKEVDHVVITPVSKMPLGADMG